MFAKKLLFLCIAKHKKCDIQTFHYEVYLYLQLVMWLVVFSEGVVVF